MPKNLYTGTDNDPFQQAQHQYLGPGWEKWFKSLEGKRVNLGGIGQIRQQSLGMPTAPGMEDIARSGAINAYLGDLSQTGLRGGDPRNPALDQVQNEYIASLRQSDAERAMAIANDPNTSARGRPIAQREDGSYTTLRSNPNDPQEPVNRQAIAAQMAPGLIAPPAPVAPKPVTYGDPKVMTVGGKRANVRIGSDGLPYDMARRPIDPATIDPLPDPKDAPDKLSALPPQFQSVIGRVLVNAPASRRKLIEDDFANVFAGGNEAELKDQIRNAAIQTENIDTKNQVQGRMATIASLNDTSAILKEMKDKGVPTNIMTGTVEDLARKLGTSTNPEYVALANRLQGTLINYRRAATGVAFGEKEGAEYAKMFPNYRNTLPVNEALIRGLQREMKTYDDVYWESKLGKEGKKFIFGEDAPAGGGGPKGETPDERIKRILGGG